MNENIKYEGQTSQDVELVAWVENRFGQSTQNVNVAYGDAQVPKRNLIVQQETIGKRYARVDWVSPQTVEHTGGNFVTVDPLNSIRIEGKKVFVQSCHLKEAKEGKILANIGATLCTGGATWYERVEIDIGINKIQYLQHRTEFAMFTEQFKALLDKDPEGVCQLAHRLLTESEKSTL